MSTFRGRVRLLRLPLFVTAVADAAAGYTVALLSVGNLAAFDWGLVGVIAGTSTGLYLFGMVENDLVDVSRDRLLGAARPLVTGEAGVGTAVFFLVLTLVLAVLAPCICPVRRSFWPSRPSPPSTFTTWVGSAGLLMSR